MTNEERVRAWVSAYGAYEDVTQERTLTALLNDVAKEAEARGAEREREACIARLREEAARIDDRPLADTKLSAEWLTVGVLRAYADEFERGEHRKVKP